MDYSEYFRQLADYYNNSRIPSKVMTGAAEIRADFNRQGSWERQCAEHLQLVLAKRRVLEIACGSGRWTQFIADVADRVVALDPCPRLLEYARELGLPNTEWMECRSERSKFVSISPGHFTPWKGDKASLFYALFAMLSPGGPCSCA